MQSIPTSLEGKGFLVQCCCAQMQEGELTLVESIATSDSALLPHLV